MPAKNHLTLEQKEKLQKALKREENGEIRERILILLLLNDSKTQQEIAEFVGCSKNKVCYWCVHGDPEKLESLKDKRMSGNHQKATEQYIEILLETIEKEPQQLGYDFGRWSAQRLATYLEKKRYSDKKRFIDFLDRSNSRNFYEVLKIFHQEIIIEWIEAGNNREDFVDKGAKIVIILDNANFHKKTEYIEKIKTEMPNIHLEYLPEYSPDYNLIELVWHSAKEYYFAS